MSRQLIAHLTDITLPSRQVSSHPEALMLYVEMLAHAHVDPSFVSLCADISLRRPGAKTSLSHSQGGGGSKPVRTARVKQVSTRKWSRAKWSGVELRREEYKSAHCRCF